MKLCLDYMELNNAIVKNKYALPKIDDLFNPLRGFIIFSKINLGSGYHKLRITYKGIAKIYFRTRCGHYEFTFIPFGLSNSSTMYRNIMN